MNVGRRAVVALANPCARAWETTRPEFAAFVSWKGLSWSTILTVNK
jgi:hypothetical protein